MKQPKLTLTREQHEKMRAAQTPEAMLKALGIQQVGFWTSTPSDPETADRLWPGSLIDKTWDEKERAKVIEYLKAGKRFVGYCGYSACRLCSNEFNGTADLTDMVFVWPEGFAHYIEDHGVKPPQVFIDHVLKVLKGKK